MQPCWSISTCFGKVSANQRTFCLWSVGKLIGSWSIEKLGTSLIWTLPAWNACALTMMSPPQVTLEVQTPSSSSQESTVGLGCGSLWKDMFGIVTLAAVQRQSVTLRTESLNRCLFLLVRWRTSQLILLLVYRCRRGLILFWLWAIG